MQVLRKVIRKIKEKTHGFLVNKVDFFLIKCSYRINRIIYRKRKSNKKNIMVLIYHLRNGGAERVASNLCDELAKKYIVILVTCEDKTNNDYDCSVKRIVVDEMRAKYFKFYDTVKQLKNIKKKYNITHTISFTAQMNYLNAMSKVGDTTIISIRNYIFLAENDNTPKNLFMNRLSIKYADKITVVSKELGDEIISNYGINKNKVIPIYNFVDKEKIDNFLKEKNDLKINKNTIITVGRLNNQKGHINLVRSFKYVVDEISDAKLLILGQGPLEEEIKKEIKRLKLGENVELLGYKSNPYIYMKKSTCFVLSSFYEGMPNVVLEAMYLGLPIISTDCKTGPKEILLDNNEYGILVPNLDNEDNEKEMAEVLIKILKDNKYRNEYSKKSLERIKDFYKNKIIKKWIEVVK